MKVSSVFANVMSLIFTIGLAPVSASTKGSHVNDGREVQSMSLQQKKWNHGSIACDANIEPAIEVHQYDRSSYILRQNKCTTYEAPFVYVLLGKEKILVLDTGATEDSVNQALYQTVQSIIASQTKQEANENKEILVLHTHGHRDHYAGDLQFEGKANTTVVTTEPGGVQEFFGFKNNIEDYADIELGDRKITIIQTPGHQEEAISIYDTQTKWLLTGDTFYPGVIYVKDWVEYRKSIARLATFIKNHQVSYILGSHIEMKNKPGEYYDIGTTYQPDEAPLALRPKTLISLNSALERSIEERTIIKDRFIVEPMGAVKKIISNLIRWFS